MAIAKALCPVLVGRDAQLSDLEDALLEALRGEGGVVLLGGEAGLGKSRLAADLARRAGTLGCRVLLGGCSEAELSLPYLPFLEAIGNHLSRSDLEQLRLQLGPAVAELAQLFPQLGQAPAAPGDAMQAKLRLFEGLVALLHEAAKPRGLLLVIEDIHWADPSTREALDYLTRRLRAEPVLVLATYRSDELHRKHPLLPIVQGWRRAGSVREVQLSALEADGIAAMIRAIFDDEAVSSEFRDFLHARTEGNPFVLEEMLKAALDRGDIFRTATGWDRKAISELRLPETVRDTILLRIERLGEGEREIIAAASVIGRSFRLPVLVGVTDRDEDTVLEALQSCTQQQLVVEDDSGTGTYSFRHALTREAVYEDMLQGQRRRLHSRVAEVLRGDPHTRSVELANHLLSAGEQDEGARMCAIAAEEAVAALAFGEAADLFERAADPAAGAARGRLLGRAGFERWQDTDPARARRLLEEAVSLLEAAGEADEGAKLRLTLGRCYWELERSDLARQEFEHARAALEQSGPSAALALAYVRLAGLESFDTREEQAAEYARRGLEIAETAGAALEHAWAWNFLGISIVGLGRIEEGLAHFQRSYDESITGGFRFQAQNAVYNAAWTNLHLGRGRAAAVWRDRIDPFEHEAWAPYIRALLATHRGDLGVALEQARKALELTSATGFSKLEWRARVILALALAETDDAAAAREVLPPISDRVEVQDATYDGLANVRVAIAAGDAGTALAAARSVPTEACGYVSPVDAVAEGAGGDAEWLAGFVGRLELSEEARRSPRWQVAIGRLSLARGEHESAVESLRLAVDAFTTEGLRLDAWHAARALAEAEFGTGERDGAERRLRSVNEEATAAGALLAARLARETAARLGLDAGAAPDLPVASDRDEAEPTGEKLVSVLFVDVRGYTAFTARVAPAELADRIGSLQRWAAAEIQRERGVVDKFAGDAVMATFNVSGASVDHAERALAAAIAIRDKAAALELPVGAGIAVGPAIVGRLAGDGNVSVLGEVTNLAARLQASSGPGEITLSGEAHRRLAAMLSRLAVSAEPVELELKGFDRPVSAFRVTG